VLSEVMVKPHVDSFDLLAHIAFNGPLLTRDDRAEAFLTREQRFIQAYDLLAREVILALLSKYRLAGIQEMTNPMIFRLSPFREMGQASGVIKRFGTVVNLLKALDEIQRRLYDVEVA
jgi:type I restriction enzyme R subunit